MKKRTPKEKPQGSSPESAAADSEQAIVPRRPNGFLVVGIGASAGGVQALKQFFENVPPDSGVAYAVILHLSPDHDSRLTEVLQAVSPIPMKKVVENVLIEPDHVYVVPPNRHLTMTDGHIGASQNTLVEERRAPVDMFFRSLAQHYGPRAVGVILSGTGANGSMGIKRIKEVGGVALVQNPREAEFGEMPRNSIATELIDDILPVEEIPARIVSYKERLGKIEIAPEVEKGSEGQEQALREILTHLRARTGHDFSNYKRPTLLRRIERRVNVRGLRDLPAYADFMRENPEETQALLKDLLISVTNFYRDKEAFAFLETDILPRILANKTSDDQLRIWTIGCATGEEAYSIAMMCAERTSGVFGSPKIQIFASDIDDTAIAVAREGFYTLNDAADVSPERLRRFFSKDGEGYRIRREIREMILFANHNIIKDPPFAHLDLISCRNLLIYLNQAAKDRAMEIAHFALDPGGYLFLGTSESIDPATDLFSTVSREHHIYQSRPTTARSIPVPEGTPAFRFDRSAAVQLSQEKRAIERVTYADLHQRLLEQYAPPSVVVNENYDVVHVSERAGRFLQVSGGEPTNNLLKMILPDLRLELRGALYRAVQRKANVETGNIRVRVDDHTEAVNIQIRPALGQDDQARGLILVLFEPAADKRDAVELARTEDEPIARQLEDELMRTRTALRMSSEQYEVQAEELKASNEELQAMNEELRSATEELETSHEELQSINEELRTVNQELKIKVEETTIASNNLQNLINSTDIGTIFLDRGLRVQFFTPAARELFNLIPSDYGRPLSDITHTLHYDRLTEDVESVLEKLRGIEHEIQTDSKYLLLRILPYRTAEDQINGVVITLIDITSRRKAEEDLLKSEERLRLLIESATDFAIFTTDLNRKVNSWNSGAEAIFGYTESEISGLYADILFTPEDQEKNAPEKEAETVLRDGRAISERWHVRKDGSKFFGSGSVTPYRSENGSPQGFVKIMRDLTEQKHRENHLRLMSDIEKDLPG